MMKNTLLFFLFIATGAVSAQHQGTVSLTWTDNVKSAVGDITITIPQFPG
jgi:hypothetical protein